MALYPCQTNAFTTPSTEFAESSSEKLFSFLYVLCVLYGEKGSRKL